MPARSHGYAGTQIYNIWQMMKRRCYKKDNKSYYAYGAKGIKVCDRWRYSFENFLLDMGPRPKGFTLDRIDSTGNYELSNCRWASRKTQSRNNNQNIRVVLKGKEMVLADACEILGLKLNTVYKRMYRGKTFEEAINV